jgi:AbrB family looped-hinge helix DNA binding protein
LISIIASKISEKGQIVIPKELRDRFHFQVGDTLIFSVVEGRLILEKIEKKLSQILRDSQPVESSVDFQRKLRAEWE